MIVIYINTTVTCTEWIACVEIQGERMGHLHVGGHLGPIPESGEHLITTNKHNIAGLDG